MMALKFAQGVRDAGGKAEILYLRDYATLPCDACMLCTEDSGASCILAEHDDAQRIFQQITLSPLLFIAAPIFFYHLPAQFKALIDRAQYLWIQREQAREAGLWSPPSHLRTAFAGLVGARKKGGKLFEGSKLSIRCFLDLFGMHLAECLQFSGYEGPGELAADDDVCARLYELGIKAQTIAVETVQRESA